MVDDRARQPVRPRAISSTQLVKNHALLLGVAGAAQGLVHPLDGAVVRVGRGGAAELSLDDEAVSGLHARVGLDSAGGYVEDLGSRNGTFVNEERIEGRCFLTDGDYVRVGNTILRYSLLDELEQGALTTLFERTVRDPLTQAYNRGYFDEHLPHELDVARRTGAPISVLLVDIDHFKRVNDTYGHRIGDAVLKIVAASIQRVLRPETFLSRYGGEEFVVVARVTNRRNGEILAERIRRHVERLRLDVHGDVVGVTVSVGVVSTSVQSGVPGVEAIVESVDAALYEAKHAGRNRVVAKLAPKSELEEARTGRVSRTLPPEAAADSAYLSRVSLRAPVVPRVAYRRSG
jgi:diguanylate cyclase (GGDEF)-like protein